MRPELDWGQSRPPQLRVSPQDLRPSAVLVHGMLSPPFRPVAQPTPATYVTEMECGTLSHHADADRCSNIGCSGVLYLGTLGRPDGVPWIIFRHRIWFAGLGSTARSRRVRGAVSTSCFRIPSCGRLGAAEGAGVSCFPVAIRRAMAILRIAGIKRRPVDP